MNQRRARDCYLTPDWATQALLDVFSQIHGSITDPCCGDGRMARVLESAGRCPRVRTNDLNPGTPADCHADACDSLVWTPRPEWCVTNPPFRAAGAIALTALQHCTVGVALLVRCTWLEPCGPSHLAPQGDRRWLPRHPPTAVISLPRISFSGDGKVDSAPTWWVVWGPVPPGVYFAEPSDGNTTAEPDPEHRPVSQMEMF